MTAQRTYSTPWRIALAYIVFSVLALAFFAAPLWHGWRVNVGTLRVFVPGDMQALADVFHRGGPAAVTAALGARRDPSGMEVTAFAGPGKQLLAGSLRRWPAEIPDQSGTYGHVIDPGDGSKIRVVVSHVILPGGYQLILGRQSTGLMSLESQFWIGMTAAVTVVLGLGAGLAWLFARRARDAQQSEERYALAMEAAGDGHVDWNLRTGDHYISPRLQQICAYAPGTVFEDLAAWVRAFPCHPEDRAAWERAVSAHLDSLEPNVTMVLRIVAGGDVRWIACHFLTTRDPAGRPVRWTGSVGDITEQKRAEAALRESQDRYALAVAGSDDGVFDADFVARRVFFSARARELTGLPPGPETMPLDEYLAGLPLHPEDLPRRMAALQAHLEGRVPAYEGEFRIRQLDGEYRWRRIHGLCVRDASGRPLRMAGSIGDVDARRRAEDSLRLSEERYALALEVAEEGHLDWNVGADEFFASGKAGRMMNVPPAGTYRSRDDLMAATPYHGDDGPRVAAAWRASLAGQDGEHEIEYRIVRGGEPRWIRERWKIFRHAGGAPQRVIGVVSDITERTQAVAALRRSEEELRRAQRLESIGTLAGGIAHDFNNILGAILGYGEMAMRSARRGTRLRRDVDSIMAAGERGRALVDRILAFSRSGVGERVPVHVEAVVREALDQVGANLPAGVVIAPRLHSGRAAMLGDSTQVHQVVMNLAANAVQAMPQGGILRVALDISHVGSARPAMLGAVAPGDYIVLEVADTGTGIRDDVLERMFDPFFTTKEVGVGTGLGLSLVHGIVTSVGGAIDVATRLGEGTSFTVHLPRSGDAPATPADEHRPLPRGDGQRVLVVDDEESLVRLATDTLESLGYATVGFTSSAAALEAYVTNPGEFDVILTDERMPGVTGLAIIRAVRTIDPSLPILLMSGFVGGAASEARDVGATDVLQKPLLARDLATSLSRALRP